MADNSTPLVQRFTIDETAARAWLRHAVAAYMGDAYGDDPSLGPLPRGLKEWG